MERATGEKSHGQGNLLDDAMARRAAVAWAEANRARRLQSILAQEMEGGIIQTGTADGKGLRYIKVPERRTKGEPYLGLDSVQLQCLGERSTTSGSGRYRSVPRLRAPGSVIIHRDSLPSACAYTYM